jgi:serine phosphatase RsbU (regulator of sigma subunit)
MKSWRMFLPCILACASVVAPAQIPSLSSVTNVRVEIPEVSLTGPWKFAPGDSPGGVDGGKFLWASPNFSDTGWATQDLHPQAGVIDPGYGNPEYIKGWSAQGFPRLAGYAWYRLRIHVAGSPQPLWIKMPDHTDDSYQVFANGQFVGEFGHFTQRGVACFRSRAIAFPLPAPDAHGDLLLAIRFYEEQFVLVGGTTGDSGGMHQAPLVGLPAQMRAVRDREQTGRILSIIVSLFVSGFLIIAAGGAIWIWLIDRPRRTYLWLAMGLILLALPALVLLTAFFTFLITQGMVNQYIAALSALGLICWIFFWRDWFDLDSQRGTNIFVIALALLEALGEGGITLSTQIPISAILTAMVLRAAAKLTLGVLLFVLLYRGARKDRTAALIAMPAILLLTVSQFSPELIAWFRIRTSIFPAGIQVTVQDVALLLLVLVTGGLAVRRFIASQINQTLERQTIHQELEQARELQQRVLIPERNTSPLYAAETAYLPARTVGGDFFQVIPHADGSLLVVVGDVSGKGMAAAMLVAVLVGAIRTCADQTFDPATVLRTLNDRLLGRAGSHFATCVVAHLGPCGQMRVANAGHLPPYRNGVALDLPGAVPLGILADSHYPVRSVRLLPDDTVTFLTDGVLEARNKEGQLLGFDETERLSRLAPDAIASAAILHGQDDDITVVGVRVCSSPAPRQDASLLETAPA